MTIAVRLCPLRLQVATDPAQEELIRLRAQLLRPWHVILHNDDIHFADDVARWLVASVPGLSSQDAWQITLQAHNTGQAVITTCPREEAELYQERLSKLRIVFFLPFFALLGQCSCQACRQDKPAACCRGVIFVFGGDTWLLLSADHRSTFLQRQDEFALPTCQRHTCRPADANFASAASGTRAACRLTFWGWSF